MKTWGTSLVLLLLAVSLLGAAPAGAKGHKVPCTNATTKPEALTRDQAKSAVRCLINRKRKAHGIGALAANGPLDGAAQSHSDFMAGHGCFDHQCSGEADFVARIKVSGYLDGATSWTVGENIAWGEQSLGTPASIVTAWMQSPGHRANILNEDFDDIGVGFVTSSPFSAHDANAGIYTTDFSFSHG